MSWKRMPESTADSSLIDTTGTAGAYEAEDREEEYSQDPPSGVERPRVRDPVSMQERIAGRSFWRKTVPVMLQSFLFRRLRESAAQCGSGQQYLPAKDAGAVSPALTPHLCRI